MQAGCALSNLFRVSEEHRPGNPLVNQDAACAQNGWILPLWKYSGREANNNPGIEGLRDDVVRSKFKVVQPIDSAYRFGNVVLGQIRKSAGRREHHLFIDSSCARIERSTEDSR